MFSKKKHFCMYIAGIVKIFQDVPHLNHVMAKPALGVICIKSKQRQIRISVLIYAV